LFFYFYNFKENASQLLIFCLKLSAKDFTPASFVYYTKEMRAVKIFFAVESPMKSCLTEKGIKLA